MSDAEQEWGSDLVLHRLDTAIYSQLCNMESAPERWVLPFYYIDFIP